MRAFKITLVCSLLLTYSCLNVFAQNIKSISSPPSPSDITQDQITLQTITNSQSPENLEDLEDVISASGHTITRQQLEAIENNPELKNIDQQTIESLKKKYQNSADTPAIEQTETDRQRKTDIKAVEPSANKEDPTKTSSFDQKNITQETNVQYPNKDLATKREDEYTVFGMDFFLPARNRIKALEKIFETGELPATQKLDALSGFVGPIDMISTNVNASVPEKYTLSAGDKVIIHFWADSIALTTYNLEIDSQGKLSVPQLGQLIVRGMTISQLQDSLKNQLERILGKKEINLIATLESLKSMQIVITGEAYRPGSYAVSAVTTLFNALQACGGPSDYGSLRNIKLLRGNSVVPVDFYDFLLSGDNSKDYPLFQGDMIFIPKAQKRITIKGEVNRPAIYELKNKENLNTIIKFSNGKKPTAYIEKIQIETVRPNQERILLDVNLRDKAIASKIYLFDGDIITIPQILPKIVNSVYLDGAVDRPGTYELKKGMKVADLFSKSNQPLGEAVLARADLIRYNKDETTTTLIPVNLKQALRKIPSHNITLAPRDTLRVYSKWEFAFYPEREVSVTGSVQRPGKYERSDSMTISDLIIKSGGLLPDTSKDKAILLRYNLMTNQYSYITINLNDSSTRNKLLKDKDELYIFAAKDIKYIPIHEVSIIGAVQRPGTYNRTKNMKLSDLLYLSGGVVPGFYNKIEIAKARNDKVMKSNTVEIAETGDVINDPLLDDGDIVMVRKKSEYFEKPIWVEISGEVKYPGRYPLKSKDEHLSSLIERAGGFTELAHPKGAVFLRDKENINSDIQRELLSSINYVTNILNELDFERQQVRNQWMLLEAKGDEESINAFPINSSVISSSDDPAEAAAIGMAPQVATQTGEAFQKFMAATEDGPGVSARARVFFDHDLEPPEKQRLIISLDDALKDQNSANDPVLMTGDSIHIPQKQETISVVGASMHPTLIKYIPSKKGKKYKYYINRAGGYAEDANKENVLVARVDGSIMHVDDIEEIEPGDIIYVPPRVMSMEIVSKTDRVIDAVKFSLVVVSSLAAFITLVGMF